LTHTIVPLDRSADIDLREQIMKIEPQLTRDNVTMSFIT
jgi:hypothetical protein